MHAARCRRSVEYGIPWIFLCSKPQLHRLDAMPPAQRIVWTASYSCPCNTLEMSECLRCTLSLESACTTFYSVSSSKDSCYLLSVYSCFVFLRLFFLCTFNCRDCYAKEMKQCLIKIAYISFVSSNKPIWALYRSHAHG